MTIHRKLVRFEGGLRAEMDFDGMKLGLQRVGLHQPFGTANSRQLRRMDEREQRRQRQRPSKPQRGF